MEVRTYYASTLEAAIALARRELGPDALLVQSKRTAPEYLHLGKYEAVFAGEAIPQRAKPFSPAPKATPRMVVPESSASPVDLVARPDFRALFQTARRSPANKTAQPVPPPVGTSISCDPGLGREGFSATVALVGPSGTGKTTTAMKLALRHGVMASRSVRLIAFDPYRVGCTRQLLHFAELFEISFVECQSIVQLQTALAVEGPDLTLIDTPGFSNREADQREELASCLRGLPKIEPQLVLRVDRKPADNLMAAARFSSFGHTRAILTALDETSDFSDLPALIAAANASVSFLATGQRLVEDLEAASPQRLSELVLNGGPKSASAAA